MRQQFQSVDEYIRSQPEAAQIVLNQVRSAIRNALPKADEVISYHMPTYKLDGEAVIYFAAWKQHYSLYAASAPLVAAFSEELKPYKTIKGTIQFPFSEPVPVKLIERIARFRAKERAGHSTSITASHEQFSALARAASPVRRGE